MRRVWCSRGGGEPAWRLSLRRDRALSGSGHGAYGGKRPIDRSPSRDTARKRRGLNTTAPRFSIVEDGPLISSRGGSVVTFRAAALGAQGDRGSVKAVSHAFNFVVRSPLRRLSDETLPSFTSGRFSGLPSQFRPFSCRSSEWEQILPAEASRLVRPLVEKVWAEFPRILFTGSKRLSILRFDHRCEEVVLRSNHPIRLTSITKPLRAAKQAGLVVREFRVDPSNRYRDRNCGTPQRSSAGLGDVPTVAWRCEV